MDRIKPYFIILLILCFGCSKKTTEKELRAQVQQPVPSPKYGLNWEKCGFSLNPARAKIESSHLIDGLDYLILYFSLSGKPIDVAQFGEYFPEYKNTPDEFARKDLEPGIMKLLDERKRELTSSILCIRDQDVIIGEYDFNKKGFPLMADNRSLKKGFSTISFVDIKSSENAGNQHGSVIYDNMDNNSLYPPFIPVQEELGRQVRQEFEYKEDPVGKEIDKYFGKKYKGFTTIEAYAILNLKNAKTDEWNGHKEIRGSIDEIILATSQGTVLAVYPKSGI